MKYADKTFKDSNPVKRFFQRSRLQDALRLAASGPDPEIVVDFGAGNGELCKQLAVAFPQAEIICYEPHPELLEQARHNLEGAANITFANDLPHKTADLLFCLEVFEHLPEREAGLAMGQVKRMLAKSGTAIFGVPIEIGFPALYKGLFRMARRFGEFDARLANILPALAGHPPSLRPEVELLPGSYYHLHHLGFDHRRFKEQLSESFEIEKVSASPFPLFGVSVNSELHFAVGKKGDTE